MLWSSLRAARRGAERSDRAFYDERSAILSLRGTPILSTTDQVQQAIAAAVGDVNQTLRKEDAPLTADPALVLVGDGGRLDSLGLVNFIVALERRLAEVSGRPVSVIDLLMSGDGVPFDTLGSLRDLLVKKMES